MLSELLWCTWERFTSRNKLVSPSSFIHVNSLSDFIYRYVLPSTNQKNLKTRSDAVAAQNRVWATPLTMLLLVPQYHYTLHLSLPKRSFSSIEPRLTVPVSPHFTRRREWITPAKHRTTSAAPLEILRRCSASSSLSTPPLFVLAHALIDNGSFVALSVLLVLLSFFFFL